MAFLLSIAVPDIAIISPVNENHLEQFWTLERYRSEKLQLLQWAKYIIAYEGLRQFIDRDAFFYSMGGMSDIDASHMHMTVTGVSADISLKKNMYHIHIPAFWAYQVENVLPVYGIAEILSLDPNKISECSWEFIPEPGRSALLQGKWDSVIIDGSYNGGFESLCKGIDSVIPFSTTHRILCFLWDMRELGSHSEKIHTELAHYILEHVDTHHDIQFFLVWPMMQKYIFPILCQKFQTEQSLSSLVLWKKIEKMLREKKDRKTIVYVKGSQNTIFLEEWIKEFLANKKDEVLLCRQSKDWLQKKAKFFSELWPTDKEKEWLV